MGLTCGPYFSFSIPWLFIEHNCNYDLVVEYKAGGSANLVNFTLLFAFV